MIVDKIVKKFVKKVISFIVKDKVDSLCRMSTLTLPRQSFTEESERAILISREESPNQPVGKSTR